MDSSESKFEILNFYRCLSRKRPLELNKYKLILRFKNKITTFCVFHHLVLEGDEWSFSFEDLLQFIFPQNEIDEEGPDYFIEEVILILIKLFKELFDINTTHPLKTKLYFNQIILLLTHPEFKKIVYYDEEVKDLFGNRKFIDLEDFLTNVRQFRDRSYTEGKIHDAFDSFDKDKFDKAAFAVSTYRNQHPEDLQPFIDFSIQNNFYNYEAVRMFQFIQFIDPKVQSKKKKHHSKKKEKTSKRARN